MWVPQPGGQLPAIEADWCDELFYGGERYGGKSDFQIGYQEDGALRFGRQYRGIMFRKTYAEMEELQARAMEVFPAEGATYKTQPSAEFPFSNCWYWPSGASVKMRYIENEGDYGRYHGHQYCRISFDEVTEYATNAGFLKMLSCLRSPYGIPCTVRLTGNPGGIGHVWVKTRYVDVSAPMQPYIDPETGFVRMFVPSKMAHNRIGMEKDPGYRNRLMAATAGNQALRKAWFEGDWNIVAGAFFANIRDEKHKLPAFTPPAHWTRFRSMDWGSQAPFSVGWWCIVDDPTWLTDLVPSARLRGYRDRLLPRGAMVRYREWYGVERDDSGNPRPNKGLRMDVEVVGRGIMERERGEKVDEQLSRADPSMWKEDGGPSFIERLLRCDPARPHDNVGPRFAQADNSRVQGWQQMYARLAWENVENEEPMLYVTEDCRDWWRTVPALQNDPHKVEDIDTRGEDHAGDETRYACMARPVSRTVRRKEQSGPKPWSYDWIVQQDESRKKEKA